MCDGQVRGKKWNGNLCITPLFTYPFLFKDNHIHNPLIWKSWSPPLTQSLSHSLVVIRWPSPYATCNDCSVRTPTHTLIISWELLSYEHIYENMKVRDWSGEWLSFLEKFQVQKSFCTFWEDSFLYLKLFKKGSILLHMMRESLTWILPSIIGPEQEGLHPDDPSLAIRKLNWKIGPARAI